MYDFDEGDDHDLIGQFETTFAEFSAGNKVLDTISSVLNVNFTFTFYRSNVLITMMMVVMT